MRFCQSCEKPSYVRYTRHSPLVLLKSSRIFVFFFGLDGLFASCFGRDLEAGTLRSLSDRHPGAIISRNGVIFEQLWAKFLSPIIFHKIPKGILEFFGGGKACWTRGGEIEQWRTLFPRYAVRRLRCGVVSQPGELQRCSRGFLCGRGGVFAPRCRDCVGEDPSLQSNVSLLFFAVLVGVCATETSCCQGRVSPDFVAPAVREGSKRKWQATRPAPSPNREYDRGWWWHFGMLSRNCHDLENEPIGPVMQGENP